MRYKNPQLVAQHCFVASFCRCFPFFTFCDQLVAQQKHLLRVEVVAKSRARVYFEQQILALLLVFHQTHNLSRNKFARTLSNQPISALHFFNPQQTFLFRVKLIAQGEKPETSTKTYNETMLHDKLMVFVSRISPPLWLTGSHVAFARSRPLTWLSPFSLRSPERIFQIKRDFLQSIYVTKQALPIGARGHNKRRIIIIKVTTIHVKFSIFLAWRAYFRKEGT